MFNYEYAEAFSFEYEEMMELMEELAAEEADSSEGEEAGLWARFIFAASILLRCSKQVSRTQC